MGVWPAMDSDSLVGTEYGVAGDCNGKHEIDTPCDFIVVVVITGSPPAGVVNDARRSLQAIVLPT